MSQVKSDHNLNLDGFNNQFYDYDFEVSDFERARINKIVEMVGSHKRVLDIGCLDGSIGAFLQKNSNDVYGIDLSKAAVEKAQKKGIKASVGDAEKRLEFEDAYFDVVCASEIIEHLYDTDKFRVDRVRTDIFQLGPLKSTILGDLLPSLGKRFVIEATPLSSSK